MKRAGAAGAALGLVIACAPRSEQSYVPHPVREAYSLLDRGERPKAIRLLENIVAAQEGDLEARLLLASAYAGEAGLDVYALHDAFQDILFSQSMKDRFFGDDREKRKRDSLVPLPEAVPREIDQARTRARRLVDRADVFLSVARRMLVLLNRFPDVREDRLPFLEKALRLLDGVVAGRDVSYYRLFLRVALLRDRLSRRLFRNDELGARGWLCQQTLDQLMDDARWLATQLYSASLDYRHVHPEKDSPFSGLHRSVEKLYASLQALSESAPPGAGMASLFLECREDGA